MNPFLSPVPAVLKIARPAECAICRLPVVDCRSWGPRAGHETRPTFAE